MAGVKVPETMQGVDLYSLIENKIPKRNDFFYQYYYIGSPKLPREEGVVTGRFKYMNYIEHNYEELFGIKADPHETHNLAKDATYKTELQALRKRYQYLKTLHGLPKTEYLSSGTAP